MPPYHLTQRQIFEFWLISITPLRFENYRLKKYTEKLKRPKNG